MTNARALLVRKYIIDIVFIVVVISLLTWFIGFVCNVPILISSVYVIYENL